MYVLIQCRCNLLNVLTRGKYLIVYVLYYIQIIVIIQESEIYNQIWNRHSEKINYHPPQLKYSSINLIITAIYSNNDAMLLQMTKYPDSGAFCKGSHLIFLHLD